MERPDRMRRLVVCVDGTWYGPDGRDGSDNCNQSNIFRIWASIKEGKFQDEEGREVEQIAKYFHGIGVGKNAIPKLNAGVTGDGCKEQIEEVYKYCCENLEKPEDELWLFGFSRGAYVVRAVASLLNDLSALSSISKASFEQTYREGLDLLKKKQRKKMEQNAGKLFHYLKQRTRESPVTKFLGLFDTVKTTQDQNLHDLSLLDSIRHVRHAVALNESRVMFGPELYSDLEDPSTLGNRSMIQAWFVGSHPDLGGGSVYDGLSLYPLQWMMIEAKRYGLVLEHQPEQRYKSIIENPITLIFPPTPAEDDEIADSATGSGPEISNTWTFKYSNGIKVEMHDLRSSHKHGNLQDLTQNRLRKQPKLKQGKSQRKNSMWNGLWNGKDKSETLASTSTHESTKIKPAFAESGRQHIVSINQKTQFFSSHRQPFDKEGKLRGYCDTELACSGTIIHPSVYFLLDVYPYQGISQALHPILDRIHDFRSSNLPLQDGKCDPWVTESRSEWTDFKPIRILVCGQAGVGKSTLINKVFGIHMTDVSHDEHGVHDINVPFEVDRHPGIILHDSRGIQAGTDAEVQIFKNFIRKRSTTADPNERLNMIWVCIDVNTSRTIHQAEELIFKTLAMHAADTPIIVVGTKKDLFLDIRQAQITNESLAQETSKGGKAIILESKKRAEELLEQEKLRLQQILEGRIDGLKERCIDFAFVSQDDPISYNLLLQKTVDNSYDEGVRKGVIAAQIVNVELKIIRAVAESVRLLRVAVVTSMTAAPIIFSSTVSTPTISRILCGAVIRSFGFSQMNEKRVDAIDAIMKTIVWSNLLKFMAQDVGTTLAVWGGFTALTLFTGLGGIPLLVGAPFLQATPAARMIVKCACDLIIILAQSYEQGGKDATVAQIEEATGNYIHRKYIKVGQKTRSDRNRVHDQIDNLIPLATWKFYKGLQISKIQSEMEKITTNCVRDLDNKPTPTDLARPSLDSRFTDSSLDEAEEIKALYGLSGSKDLELSNTR